MVDSDGPLGRAIRASQKKKKATTKKCSQSKKCSGKQCTWVPNPKTSPYKKAGKTKGYADRLSAAWAAPRGITRHFYAGKWHKLTYDCNGRPRWA
jgi:hypothetical protein